MDAPTCTLIEISRGTTHDGPGLRTTVFLKGCPLRCRWCQNPEGIPAAQGVWWEARTCIGCLACVAACPHGALTATDDGIVRDHDLCTACGACVEACPARAMTFTGQTWTLDALVKEVLKDREYYDAFGGGVTVSGGEPLGQYPFVAAFFRRLHAAGVHTALDSCGLAPPAALEAVLPHTDHVLYDIKLLDPALHRQFTGHTNDRILTNLATVAEAVRQAARQAVGQADRQADRQAGCAPSSNGCGPTRLWIRTPLIPDATATPANIGAIGRYIRDTLADVVERWELCAFNSACRQKYDKLGVPWAYEGYPLMDQPSIDQIRAAALSTGIPPDRLVISGLIGKGG